MRKTIWHLIILLLFTFGFSNLAHGEVTKPIPKIDLVSIDHLGDSEILNINSTAEGKIQFQIFYTKKNQSENWFKMNLVSFLDGWTYPTTKYIDYKIDISELNLNTNDYRFDIRVKNANTDGITSNELGAYDNAYNFVSSSLPNFINKSTFREFSSSTDVSTNKIWAIKLNKQVHDLSNFKIEVLDSLGNAININSCIDEHSKTELKILPPENGYNSGETYYLLIDTLIPLDPNTFIWEFKIKQKSIVNDSLITELLLKHKSWFNSDIINNPSKYNLQILYTEINRDKSNIPTFTSYKYNVDNKKYFYPASSIKLSACILSLDKINNLKINGLSKYTTMNIAASGYGQTSRNGESISSYIQKILLYSDNNSFNRLYEFLGQKYYNDTLLSKGYKNSKIIHRLSEACNYENNKYTNPITFYCGNTKIYEQPLKYSGISYNNKGLSNLCMGNGEIGTGRTNYFPNDFICKNFMSIEDLQAMVKTVFFNNYMARARQFNLTQDDMDFLKKNMKDNGSSNCKYLVCGGSSKIPSGVEIYNKMGIAYGELTDNAYIVDKNSGREFLLTATIFVSKNGNYDYYSKGMPFFKNLGLMFLDYNKQR